MMSLPSQIAPHGSLRCVINLGNLLLAQNDGHNVRGVSVDLSQALAQELNLSCELVVVKNARESVQAIVEDRADVGFFAIDPARAEVINFTHPYLLIEGSYLVRKNSFLQHNDQIDHPDHRIVVGLGSAYDLYLTRHIQHAQLVRASSSENVVPTFLSENHHVAAGVRQQLESDAQKYSEIRLLPGHFMVIQQAMGISTSKSSECISFINQFIQNQLKQGLLKKILETHQIQGVKLAPVSQ